MKKNVYFYIFDTMADWEPGYVTAELHSGRYFRKDALTYDVKTVSINRDLITTMGGAKIVPDMTLEKVDIKRAGLLLLPGGATWLEPFHKPVFSLASEFLNAGIPVAAICGATIGLAANGFLNHSHHTSNSLDYLKATCSTYTGEAFYVQKPAVASGNLITASGIAPLDFAHAVLEKLDVLHPTTLEAWYQLYKTHDVSHYFALMESLPYEA